jgi:hypothetical protein
VAVQDLGVRELKNVEQPMRLFRLRDVRRTGRPRAG